MNILYLADPNSIHDVRWINFFCEDRDFVCFVLPRACNLERYDANRSQLNGKARLLGPLADPSTIRPIRTARQFLRIRRIVAEFKIDLIHILYAEPNALWGNAKSLLKIPMILSTRGTDILKTIPSFFQRSDLLSRLVAMQYRRAFSNMDRITCTSEAQTRVLKALEVKTPVHVIRTGVDTECLRVSVRGVAVELGISGPFVLMPRGMKPVYNHEFTLDAIALLDRPLRRQYAFVFLNVDGGDEAYAKRIIEKAETIDANFMFLPTLDRSTFISLLRESRTVVMNPHSDGSPVTAMEAMACGVPVILPPHDYDPAIYSEAWYFGEWRPSALRDTLAQVLLSDPQILRRRIEVAQRKILTDATTEGEMLKIKTIYDSVAQ